MSSPTKTATSSKSAALLYKPVGLVSGLIGGLVANAVFGQVWKRVAHDDAAPEATDQDRDWGEILAAAALQGLIFATVRTVINRGGAKLFARWTGEWPA